MLKISRVVLLFVALALTNCASKKDLLYFQDASNQNNKAISYSQNTIQHNDILSITIGALVPESAAVYNKQATSSTINTSTSIEMLQLQGYLVNLDGTITLPVLGKTKVAGKTINNLELELVNTLETGGHLVAPTVNIRLLNAKITILGEVQRPGTYNFTEQSISLPQALGYAGDLTINGKRDDIMLIREIDGVRSIVYLDLTTANWMNNPSYTIKPNDVIVVSPNQAKVKSAGIIGNASTVLAVVSVVLSTVILLTR